MDTTLALKKHQISDVLIEITVNAILSGDTLSNLAKDLGENFTPEQAYVIAKAVSVDVLQVPLDETCPSMCIERMEIAEKEKDKIIQIVAKRKEQKVLSELLTDLYMLEQETKLKRLSA